MLLRSPSILLIANNAPFHELYLQSAEWITLFPLNELNAFVRIIWFTFQMTDYFTYNRKPLYIWMQYEFEKISFFWGFCSWIERSGSNGQMEDDGKRAAKNWMTRKVRKLCDFSHSSLTLSLSLPLSRLHLAVAVCDMISHFAICASSLILRTVFELLFRHFRFEWQLFVLGGRVQTQLLNTIIMNFLIAHTHAKRTWSICVLRHMNVCRPIGARVPLIHNCSL